MAYDGTHENRAVVAGVEVAVDAVTGIEVSLSRFWSSCSVHLSVLANGLLLDAHQHLRWFTLLFIHTDRSASDTVAAIGLGILVG